MVKKTAFIALYLGIVLTFSFAYGESKKIVLNEDSALAAMLNGSNSGYLEFLSVLFKQKEQEIFLTLTSDWQIVSSKEQRCRITIGMKKKCKQDLVLEVKNKETEESHRFVMEVRHNPSKKLLNIEFYPTAVEFLCSESIYSYVSLTGNNSIEVTY